VGAEFGSFPIRQGLAVEEGRRIGIGGDGFGCRLSGGSFSSFGGLLVIAPNDQDSDEK
jgi:hypothetical protein